MTPEERIKFKDQNMIPGGRLSHPIIHFWPHEFVPAAKLSDMLNCLSCYVILFGFWCLEEK